MNRICGPGTRGGSGRDLPAGPFSTPRFLAAQRSAVSSRREEIAVVALAAQHNTRVCGPLCDPMGSSQVVLTLSGSPTVFYWYSLSGLQLQPSLQLVQRSTCRAANMAVPTAARHFCSAKILAGRAALGDGGPQRRGRSSRAKKFPEEICFAPRRVCQICRTPD